MPLIVKTYGISPSEYWKMTRRDLNALVEAYNEAAANAES